MRGGAGARAAPGGLQGVQRIRAGLQGAAKIVPHFFSCPLPLHSKRFLNLQVHPSSSRPGEGILGADFVFYISAMETERCKKGMTVAYAAHCQQEAALDRWDSLSLSLSLTHVGFFTWAGSTVHSTAEPRNTYSKCLTYTAKHFSVCVLTTYCSGGVVAFWKDTGVVSSFPLQ